MRIFVDVRTPGNGKTYEFQLYSSMTVRQVKLKMIEEITDAEDGNITLDPSRAILSSLTIRKILPDTDTLASVGVTSGQDLLLI